MPRCITEYLKQEHHELLHLLNELTAELRALPLARNSAEAFERLRNLCREISQTLHTHLEEEEEILYPALEAHVQGVSGTLERMRIENDAGEAAEKVFLQSVERLTRRGGDREGVVQSGRRYIQWVRGHLLNENGRLLPLVERRLDPQTQREVRHAMEELSRESAAHIVETFPYDA